MCGIGGIMMREGTPEPAQLDALSAALVHRGPDGAGEVQAPGVGMVHRRLAIVDLPGGDQPFYHGQDALIANGEIYNHREVRESLAQDGDPCTTQNDCEPILPLYQRDGLGFVDRLRGMYALAIFDHKRKQVVLARDRFGIKPLYLSATEAGVAFASEPAALLACGWIERQVNKAALAGFFRDQRVVGRGCLFAGIERVLPGEVIVIRGGRIVQREHRPLTPPLVREADLIALDACLRETVRAHLMADVPVGTFLSSGIDSSVLATCLSAETNGTNKTGETGDTQAHRTYCIGFADLSVADERSAAAQLAQQVGLASETLTFTEADFWQYLPRMTRAMDDLAADYACLPLLKLAAHASEHHKVILTGEGGDEMFAGYGHYRRGGLKIVRDFLRQFWGRSRKLWFLHVDISPDPKIEKKPYESLNALHGNRQKHRHCRESGNPSSGFSNTHGAYSRPRPAQGTPLQARQMADITGRLPEVLLTKLDRCLMTYSVEGRVPLVDHQVFALAMALPDRAKVRGRMGKWLLRRWLARYQPKLAMRRKKGFTVPIRSWLEARRPALVATLRDHPGLGDIVTPSAFEVFAHKPLDKHRAQDLFALLCYACWFDWHITERDPAVWLSRVAPNH